MNKKTKAECPLEILELAKEVCRKKLPKCYYKGMQQDDVTQNVLIRVWSGFASYDEDKGSYYTFVNTIAENIMKNGIREMNSKGALAHRESLKCDWDIIVDTIEDKDSDIAVSETLQNILNLVKSPKERAVILLKAKGYKPSEIAKKINCSDARVSQILKQVQLRRIATN
jgi:RNA polymerase sporulation-specific sigma factor